MTVRPGECYVIDRDGVTRTQAAYPLPSEPHSAADLLRPLATDNARLRDEVDRLTVMNEVLRHTLMVALRRESVSSRIIERLEAWHDEQAARIAELEAALRRLLWNHGGGDDTGIYDHYFCVYGCNPQADDNDDLRHAPDCPAALARAVLSKEA